MPTEHGAVAVAAADAVVGRILDNAGSMAEGTIRLVNAPAGAGKTGLVTRLIPRHLDHVGRIAVVTQTNAQAEDLASRLAVEQPALQVCRFISNEYVPPRLPANVLVTSDSPTAQGERIVIATAAKWMFAAERTPSGSYDVGIIDEAYQMQGSSLLYIGDLFARLEMVGDPGQLAPFTPVETDRWAGLSTDPVRNAVDTVLQHHDVRAETLPVTRRLPAHAAEIVRSAFYPQLDFAAATEHGARRLRTEVSGTLGPVDRVIDAGFEHGWALAVLPQRAVLRNDQELAGAAAAIALRILERGTRRDIDEHSGLPLVLGQDRIAIGAGHRDQVAAVKTALHRFGLDDVIVDTANRLQGREFDVVIAWHPLSAQIESSAFHLDVGRMCVLTTRHRHACIVITRDGVTDVLESSVPLGEGILGDSHDRTISGWEAQLLLMDHLERFRVDL